jgi:hypothetical protein
MPARQLANDRRDNAPLTSAAIRREHGNIGKLISQSGHAQQTSFKICLSGPPNCTGQSNFQYGADPSIQQEHQ